MGLGSKGVGVGGLRRDDGDSKEAEDDWFKVSIRAMD